MDTPVPIPNTAVKHLSADNTWLETARESKSLPDLYQALKLITWGFVYVLRRNYLRRISRLEAFSLEIITSRLSLFCGKAISKLQIIKCRQDNSPQAERL